MSRPHLSRQERACTDKVRLSDEAAARATAMVWIGSGRFTSAKAWVYACRYCRGWHITSKFGQGNAPGAVTATNALIAPPAIGGRA